jgi:hypothetical protein
MSPTCLKTPNRAVALAALLACSLLVFASPAGAAKPARGQYLGVQGLDDVTRFEDLFARASESSLVAFAVGRRDRFRLRTFVVSVSSKCSNGRVYSGTFFARRVPVAKDGSFGANLTENLTGQAFTKQSQLTLTGRFTRARRANVQLQHNATGNDGTTCQSGARTVSVRPLE